jgi:hypothetical protein
MSKSLREGASLSRRSVRDRYQSWQRHHRLSAADSLYRIAEAPLSSVLTWLVIGIALALPVGLNVLLENSQQLIGQRIIVEAGHHGGEARQGAELRQGILARHEGDLTHPVEIAQLGA